MTGDPGRHRAIVILGNGFLSGASVKLERRDLRKRYVFRKFNLLEHDPEKWAPVFPRDKRGTRLRGDHAQTKR